MPSLLFNPSPPATDEILALCGDPSLTLTDIAKRHQTSVEALTLFLARRDISGRLDTLHSAAVSRTRFLATTLLPSALEALRDILAQSKLESEADQAALTASRPGSAHPPSPSPRSPELRQRCRETRRRAASRILTLATFNPARTPPAAWASPPMPSAQEPRDDRRTRPVQTTRAAPGNAEEPTRATAQRPDNLVPTPPIPNSPPLTPHSSLPITFPPGRFSSLPDLPTPAPTKHRSLRAPPRSPAAILQSAGAAPHEHWP